MKMAKLQKTTLDPAKISGRCGRLKCCLRYEYDTYLALEKTLPSVGSRVETAKGTAGSSPRKYSPKSSCSSSTIIAGSSFRVTIF